MVTDALGRSPPRKLTIKPVETAPGIKPSSVVHGLTIDKQANARSFVLGEAAGAVLEDRSNTYGPPEDNFANIAGLWSAYKGITFTRADVAAMNALIKVGRLMTTPDHKDSWVDIAGYAACGLEAAQADKKGEKDDI